MQFEQERLRFGPIYALDLALGSLGFAIEAATRMLTVFNHVFNLDLDDQLKLVKADIRAWLEWLQSERPSAIELIAEIPSVDTRRRELRQFQRWRFARHERVQQFLAVRIFLSAEQTRVPVSQNEFALVDLRRLELLT